MQHKKKYITAMKFIAGFLIIVLILLLVIILRQPTPNTLNTAKNTLTFSPALIPAATEIGNPERGPEYYGGEVPPRNFPLTQYYHRWCWSAIEPTEGNYNFQLIDNLAATAQAHGGTFGWRIMPENDHSLQPCLQIGRAHV